MFFFFFKQKTAYEMRISDWSSDVCSSDLQRRCSLREQAAAMASMSMLSAGPACPTFTPLAIARLLPINMPVGRKYGGNPYRTPMTRRKLPYRISWAHPWNMTQSPSAVHNTMTCAYHQGVLSGGLKK